MSYIQFSQLHHFHQLVQEHQHHPVRRIKTVMILNQAMQLIQIYYYISYTLHSTYFFTIHPNCSWRSFIPLDEKVKKTINAKCVESIQ
jgi:hypothetical protein